ncbi:unnamed protein product [Prorocentrum cordatum]|uniref:Subtilisin n=1 Tax=Prorocentrum cordatum TaxID=2364126 RepID=A0ABN9S0Q6_9DINO|nr:unnamed protein product [Polarella glacialis]
MQQPIPFDDFGLQGPPSRAGAQEGLRSHFGSSLFWPCVLFRALLQRHAPSLPLAPMAGHLALLLLLGAPSAAPGLACPGDSDSEWKIQANFSWAGSAGAYGGSSTLEADAAPLKAIGEHAARIPEASDAKGNQLFMVDGQDGDVDFQFGNLKPIATVGEVDYQTGMMIVGVPDGLGAILHDDDTVRVIVQSESYGPITQQEAFPYLVNDGAAAITGSHVQYVDYDREMMSGFMTSALPASSMVKGAGELIQFAYNLRGELVGPRNRTGPTTVGAFESNVDVDGNYALYAPPADGGVSQREADWTMMSLCSAQLVEKEMWGAGNGFVDDIFLTNEEWQQIASDTSLVGLPAHAIDIATKTAHSWAPTVSGFEKPSQFNADSTEYVAIAISGYNGAFGSEDYMLANKKAMYGTRPDGTDWVWPENICPSRIYIGRKGYDALGNPATDFLSRNGLAYGQMYGFAVDSADSDFSWRDEWHKTHYNGDSIAGKFYPIDWRWNGTVTNFEHDGAWHFQIAPLGGAAGYVFWNGAGNDQSGSKTEHVSPDPLGETAYYQTSTAGYFGKYVISGLAAALTAAAGAQDPFPTELDAVYHLYQGETPINDLIDLGEAVKGQTANGGNQTTMCDSSADSANECGSTDAPGKLTFEDIDGFEAISSSDGVFAVIQEDGGNKYGERMFVYEALLTYGESPSSQPFKFVAQSGGAMNSRMMAGAGVPANSNPAANAHEFSGVADLSGLLAKGGDGAFALSQSAAGHERRAVEATVAMDDKIILIGLQAHNHENEGVIANFNADRGGQWLLWQPNLAGDGARPTEAYPAACPQYPCNPFSNETCYINLAYLNALEAACGQTITTPGACDAAGPTPSPTAAPTVSPNPSEDQDAASSAPVPANAAAACALGLAAALA